MTCRNLEELKTTLQHPWDDIPQAVVCAAVEGVQKDSNTISEVDIERAAELVSHIVHRGL